MDATSSTQNGDDNSIMNSSAIQHKEGWVAIKTVKRKGLKKRYAILYGKELTWFNVPLVKCIFFSYFRVK